MTKKLKKISRNLPSSVESWAGEGGEVFVVGVGKEAGTELIDGEGVEGRVLGSSTRGGSSASEGGGQADLAWVERVVNGEVASVKEEKGFSFLFYFIIY